MQRLQNTSIAAQDISSALLVDTYTADGTYQLLINVYLSGLAGNGTYTVCLTKQLGGAGSAFQSATSGITLASTVTTAFLPTVALPVLSGDVIKVYVLGLAGDISVSVRTETFDVTPGGLDAADIRTAVGLAAANLDTQLSTIDGVVDAVLLDTGTDGVVLANDAITSAKFDESTAYPLKSADAGVTQVARVGADGDTLETLSDQIDALPTDADVNAQVDVALADIDLDHFIQVTAGSEEPTDGSYLDQIMHKDGSQTFSSATDSLEALRDALVKSSAAGTLSTGELTVIRGDTYDSDSDNAIEGLGNIATRTKLWIVVKKSLAQADSEATLYCEETAGITIMNGAAYATAAHSVITVTDAAAGDLTWTLDEAVTDDLTPGLYFYDIQTLNAAGTVKTWRRAAQFTVQGDVARVIV